MLVDACSHNVNVKSKIPQMFMFRNFMFCRLSGHTQQFETIISQFKRSISFHMEQLLRQLSYSLKYKQQEFHLFCCILQLLLNLNVIKQIFSAKLRAIYHKTTLE